MNPIAHTSDGSDAISAEFTAFDRLLRGRLIAQLARLRHGRLVIVDACGMVEVGTAAMHHPELQIRLEIHGPGFYRAIAANGSVGAGESYMDGQWRSCACWCATATCSTAWRRPDWRTSAAGRCAAGTRCSEIR